MAGWSKAQAREGARRLRKELGEAWQYMTAETREAFACKATMGYVTAVSDAGVEQRIGPKEILELHVNIRQALKLE